MRHFLKYLIGMVAVAIISCDSPEQPGPFDIGKDYFPLRKGLYQIYDVNEVNFLLGVPETLAYELKMHVVDSFLSMEGEYRYVIHRSMRDSEQDSWRYIDTWSGRLSNHEAVIDEENIPYLKLILPISRGTIWDGNKYNSKEYALGEIDEYILEEVNTAYTFNDEDFDDCITVIQEDFVDNIVGTDQRKEIYGRGVGLVYKESTQFKYCTDTNLGCLGQQIVESGLIYKQTIKAYGME